MHSLSRSSFLQRMGAFVLGVPLIVQGCANDSSKRPVEQRERVKLKWRMVTTWPPRFPVLGEGARLFADWVREMSDGDLDIQVFGAGELVPAMEVFDVVSSGTAQMGSGAAYYWAGKITAAQFFGSVPFGMNPQQMTSWLLSGGGLALWEELYAPFDLMPFPGGNTGIQMGGWFNKEIRTPEDLQGLKMRIPGLGGKVLQKAGGTAVLSAGGEIYTNLERGVIDATEWVGPYHDHKMGFQDIAKYYYYPGWQEPGSVLELIVHKPVFLELPAYLQEILRTAALRLHLWTLAEFDAQNGKYLELIRKDSKVQLKRFPEPVLAHLKKLTLEVLEEIAMNDPMSRKVKDAYFSYLTSIRPWFDIAEKDYYFLQDQ